MATENTQNNNAGSQGYFQRIRSTLMGNNGMPKQTSTNPDNQGDNRQNDPNRPNNNGNAQNQNGNQGQGGSQSQQPQTGNQNEDYLGRLYTSKQADPEAPPQFSLNGDSLKNLTETQDFAAGISDEDIQALGVQDGAALRKILNVVGRGAYRSALEHQSTLTGKFTEARFAHYDKQFGSKVRDQSVNAALSGLPNYQNPAVKEHLNNIASRLASQHPDAPPHEIAQEAQRLLMEIANGVNPENSPEARAKKEAQGTTDWSQWLAQDANQ